MLRSRMRSARQLLQPFEASGRTQNADVVRVSRLLALTAAQSHEEFSSDVIRRSSEFCERKAVIRRRISIGSSGSFVSSFFKTKLVLSTVKRADVSEGSIDRSSWSIPSTRPPRLPAIATQKTRVHQSSATSVSDRWKRSAFSRQRQSLWLWKPFWCARGFVPRPLPFGVAIPPSFFRPTNIVRLLFGPGRFNFIVERRFPFQRIRSVCLGGRGWPAYDHESH